MTGKFTTLSGVLLCSILLISCSTPESSTADLARMVPVASFIFKGKVVALHTASTDEDNVNDHGVVEVTQTLSAPAGQHSTEKELVTVRFKNIAKIKEGEERLFFTQPYWYGESIGVDEKASFGAGHPLFDNKQLPAMIEQARSAEADSQLQRVLKSASIVVAGKVIGLREIPYENRGLTEHDPEWKEAEISVAEILKGSQAGKTLKVVFASSKDVMYYHSPKVSVGDEGVFIMHPAEAKLATLLHNDKMMIDPSAFLKGIDNAKKVKSLLR